MYNHYEFDTSYLQDKLMSPGYNEILREESSASLSHPWKEITLKISRRPCRGESSNKFSYVASKEPPDKPSL
jgi:hypothetical protein